MSVATQAKILLNAMTDADLALLPPAERRRFGELCRHWAERAEPKREAPRSGVLSDLSDGRGSQ